MPEATVPSNRVPHPRALVVNVLFLSALGPLAMSAFVPGIPAIQAEFEATGAQAQLTLSIALVAMAVSSIVFGQLSDLWGRRPVILASLVTAVAGCVFCVLSSSLIFVIIGRALQATGCSAGFVVARVVIKDLYDDVGSARLLAAVTAAMAFAPMLGPILGGLLIASYGWRSVFVSVAIVATALLLSVATFLPETLRKPDKTQRSGEKRHVAGLLSRADFLAFVTYGAFSQGALFAFLAGAPYIMTETLSYPIKLYGFYFFIVPTGFAASSFVARRLSGSSSLESLTLAGAAIGAIACALGGVWNSLYAVTPLSLFLPAALMGCGMGLAMAPAQVGVLRASDTATGIGSGIFAFVQLFIGAIATQLVGIFQHGGGAALFAVMFVASAVALVASATLVMRSHEDR